MDVLIFEPQISSCPPWTNWDAIANVDGPLTLICLSVSQKKLYTKFHFLNYWRCSILILWDYPSKKDFQWYHFMTSTFIRV